MAGKSGKSSSRTRARAARAGRPRLRALLRPALRWAGLAIAGAAVLMLVMILVFGVINPPTTPYMLSERARLGKVEREWVPIEAIAPVMARSVVAAEDANFCRHWGFDMTAIRAALAAGADRGASTITQQVVKNVFLWQGRSWPRKALEALMTPMVELFWSKRRILEVYLNVAEFGEGAFGVAAGAARAFHVEPAKISAEQAGLLAAVLPDPKGRSAARPTAWLRRRGAEIADGAATIAADGRAACFEH